MVFRLGNMIGSGAYGRVYLGMVPQVTMHVGWPHMSSSGWGARGVPSTYVIFWLGVILWARAKLMREGYVCVL